MGMLPRIAAVAGLSAAALLSLAQAADAKCLPATARALPKPASANFVAVLVTCDDQHDALRVFADVSTKHPSVLSSTALEVQEVNLGAKGVYYRTLVGTPGSKGAAAGTCTQLKAAGYNWCRVMRH